MKPPMLITNAFTEYVDLGWSIGKYSYTAHGMTVMGDQAKLVIGNFCSIGMNARIYIGSEHRTDWITTYPFPEHFGWKHDVPGISKAKGDVVIGSDVWIGDDVSIMSGVWIGDGAVIGAKALVTSDVMPYTIVGGVPATLIRHRFEMRQIMNLLVLKWWEWPDEIISCAIPRLLSSDIDGLIDWACENNLFDRKNLPCPTGHA
jgi:acetyltransferase-like isoleucine patch superfamily enzyme